MHPQAMNNPDKSRINRLRQVAERRGYRLSKIRRIDPLATDYGKFWLFDVTGAKVSETPLSLSEIEARLEGAAHG